MPRIRKLSKLPKRKVTIPELLNQDGVKQILDAVAEHLNEIEDIIIIYSYEGKLYHSCNTDDVRFIQLLETIKFDKLYERYE